MALPKSRKNSDAVHINKWSGPAGEPRRKKVRDVIKQSRLYPNTIVHLPTNNV